MRPFFFLFLLLIPIASALFGGETFTKHFDKCSNLTVKIYGNLTIDEGEFMLNPECKNITTTHIYNCDCYDNYTFFMTTAVNAVNEYTLDFDYDYNDTESDDGDDDSSSSSGGGGSSSTTSSSSVNCQVKAFTNSTYCHTWCDRYARVNNCYASPYNNTQCCRVYYPLNITTNQLVPKKEVVQPAIGNSNQGDNKTIEEVAPSPTILNDTTEEPTVPESDNSWIWAAVIIFVLAVIFIGVGIWVWFGGGE